MNRALLLCVLCASVVGCSGGGSGTAPAQPAGPVPIRVLDHDGHPAFRLLQDKNGSQVLDGEETLLARLKDFPDHVQVADQTRPILRIKRLEKPNTWMVENMSAAAQLTFSQQAGGGYEIADASGRLLYTVRQKDSGLDVLDAKGKALCRLTLANGQVAATRADGFKLYEMHGSKSLVAASALLLDKFNVTTRAALFAFLHKLDAPS